MQHLRALGGGTALAGSLGVLLSFSVDCGKTPAPALLAGIEANVTAAAFATAMGASVVSLLATGMGLPTQSFQVTVLPLGFVGPSSMGAPAPGSPGVAGVIGGGVAGAALLALAAAAWLAYSRRRKGRAGGDKPAASASPQAPDFMVKNPHARSASLRRAPADGAAPPIAHAPAMAAVAPAPAPARAAPAAPAPTSAPAHARYAPAAPRCVAFAAVSAATGGFAAVRLIGQGGTGEVFRGEFEGAPVAVKLLKLRQGASAEERTQLQKRFAAELRTLRVFAGHPRIVELRGFTVNYEAGGGGGGGGGAEAAQRPYALVFELLEEGSLADHLRGEGGAAPARPLTALERVDAALGVAQGLAYLHGMREEGEDAAAGELTPVLHRDVKAANVGLTRHNGALFAKLLDCGLAKAMRPPEPARAAGGSVDSGGGGGAATFSKGIVMGTPGYMAPEVATGKYTVQSEVFSLGVVLLELLTGRVATAQTATEMRDAADDGEGAATVAASAEAGGIWPPAAAAALAVLALSCIAVRPAKRPANMRTVAAGLRGVRAALEAAAAAVPLANCGVCLEDVPAASGVLCKAAAPAQRHFVCHGCLQQHVDDSIEPRRLEDLDGAVPCVDRGCAAAAWAVDELEAHLDKATLIRFIKALNAPRLMAKARREAEVWRLAEEKAANDASLELAERVRRHRNLIAERDLTLHCPHKGCGAAFNDYSGCNALQCAVCACGFCALCLLDCGRDAHAHYYGEHPGNIFDHALFERTHRERRARAVAAAVRALAGEGAALQRALVAELAKADLRDLGIGAEDVLREAGVAEAAGRA